MFFRGYKDHGSFERIKVTRETTNMHSVEYHFNNGHFVKDELATMRRFGSPDMILTMGCNSRWPEITRYVSEYDISLDENSDICSRVFSCKLNTLMDDLVCNTMFGEVNAASWAIDFGPSHLPTAYIFLYLKEARTQPADIDLLISAEIPNQFEDPELYEVVKDFMIESDPKSSFYPKPFSESTFVGEDNTMMYRRRNDNNTVMKDGLPFHNGYVKPYNGELSVRYHTYLHVEWLVTPTEAVKLLTNLDGRHIRRVWSNLGLKTTFRTVPVHLLRYHLPDQTFPPEFEQKTKFLKWMEYNATDGLSGPKQTFTEFSSKFEWDLGSSRWIAREDENIICRLNSVPECMGETYYLYVLLTHLKSPTGFDSILTVDGHKCATFKEACVRLGLVDFTVHQTGRKKIKVERKAKEQ